MPKCGRCGRWGLFLKLDNENVCTDCAEELKRKRREEEQRLLAEEKRRHEEMLEEKRRQERLREEEESRKAKIKRFEPPQCTKGFCLAYTYRDVEFYCPDIYRDQARVEPNKQINFSYDHDNPDDPDSIMMKYGEVILGYMYDNKLRKMLRDFASDDMKDFLAVTRYWTDKPVFDLFFYHSADLILGKMKKAKEWVEYTLVSNKNKQMQESIYYSAELGSPVDAEYDYEKERYLAQIDYDPVGYFPASAEKFFSTHDQYVIRVSSLKEDESGKYTVKVLVAVQEEE